MHGLFGLEDAREAIEVSVLQGRQGCTVDVLARESVQGQGEAGKVRSQPAKMKLIFIKSRIRSGRLVTNLHLSHQMPSPKVPTTYPASTQTL